ncbi:MAG: DUF366 family protein [Actinomycetota bacterium]|nr:DUF366 family protein [Actinomycetota bacterium]
MKGKYLKGKKIEYDGSQLSPLWAFMNFDIQGNSIVSFRGPCNIKEEYMVDMADRKNKVKISSPDMVHFVLELFGYDILKTVLTQRLLISAVMDTIRDLALDEDADVERENDNIYGYPPGEDDRGKLSVSVATCSPISGLIHLGLNITAKGTPVRAVGLKELGIQDIDGFVVEVEERFISEMNGIEIDSTKVRPVI